MNKILALVLVLAMALTLFAACGTDTETPTTENKETAAPTTEEVTEGETTEATEAKPAFTTVEEGKLIMATNAYFPPYEFYEGEQIVGIDAEIAAAIAEKLGLELVINDMEFDSIITAVATGAADFGLAGMTITEDRLKEVDFSISYATGVQAIIVKEGSPITTVDDLYAEGATYKIGVQLGTTGDIYASDDFGAERVSQYSKGNEAVAALLGGDIDCVIIDNQPAESFVAANEGLVILETAYANEDYAACLAQNNDALLDAINQAIEDLIVDGTIDAIIAKYIQ